MGLRVWLQQRMVSDLVLILLVERRPSRSNLSPCEITAAGIFLAGERTAYGWAPKTA